MGAYSVQGATGFYYGLTLRQLLCSTEESGGSSNFSAPSEVKKNAYASVCCLARLTWHVGVNGASSWSSDTTMDKSPLSGDHASCIMG